MKALSWKNLTQHLDTWSNQTQTPRISLLHPWEHICKSTNFQNPHILNLGHLEGAEDILILLLILQSYFGRKGRNTEEIERITTLKAKTEAIRPKFRCICLSFFLQTAFSSSCFLAAFKVSLVSRSERVENWQEWNIAWSKAYYWTCSRLRS